MARQVKDKEPQKKLKKPNESEDLPKTGPGTLYVVATPIGNSMDWTERAKKVLSEVEVVAAEDTRVLKKELGKVKLAPKRVLSHHEHNEDTSAKGLLEILMQGGDVALASDAGTPLVSDPGFRIISEARAAGIKVVPVPGASSLTAALSISSLGGQTVFFGGFLPPQSEPRKRSLQRCQRAADTLVFFEAPHRLRETLLDAATILGEESKAIVCRELTKPYEEVKSGTLAELKKFFQVNEPRGEFVICFTGSQGELLDKAETHKEVVRLLGHGRSASDILEELQPVSELTRKLLYDLIISLKKTI